MEDAIDTALATVETEAKVRDVKLVRGRVEDGVVTGHAIRLEQTPASISWTTR